MEDHSSSSPPNPKSLTTEQGFSGSAGVGESESTHVSSPRMLSPPPPHTMDNPISGSETPFGSSHLPPPENPTMVQEFGHQENPTMHQDLPPSNEVNQPLDLPPNNAPEIQELGPQENSTHGTGNPDAMPTSEVLEMVQELSSEQPGQLSLPSSQTSANAVQDLRFQRELVPVLRPWIPNVPYFTPQTQTHWPYGTWGFAPVSVTLPNAYAPGPHAVNIQGNWRLQQQQPQPQRMITPLVRAQPVRNIWVGPGPGVYQLNVAVATQVMFGINLHCMGAVIRDHVGVVQGAIIRRWDSIYQDLAQAEFLIYETGITISLFRGHDRLIAETESHHLASRFQNLPSNEAFSYFEARHVSRNRNCLAHMFAEMALWHNPTQGFLCLNETDIEAAFGTRYMPY